MLYRFFNVINFQKEILFLFLVIFKLILEIIFHLFYNESVLMVKG